MSIIVKKMDIRLNNQKTSTWDEDCTGPRKEAISPSLNQCGTFLELREGWTFSSVDNIT